MGIFIAIFCLSVLADAVKNRSDKHFTFFNQKKKKKKNIICPKAAAIKQSTASYFQPVILIIFLNYWQRSSYLSACNDGAENGRSITFHGS